MDPVESDERESKKVRSITRRQLIKAAGGLGGVVARRTSSASTITDRGKRGSTFERRMSLATWQTTNRVVEVMRPDDLLVLEFEFINLDLFEAENELPVRFMRLEEGQPAYVIVRFPPQHIVEQDFAESQSVAPPPASPPILSRIAGVSRLVFNVPETVEFIPYSVEHMLDWSAWEPSVAPLALPPGVTPAEFFLVPTIAAPLPEHTAIEMPYRLIVSPHSGMGWTHATRAITRAGRTELWHTRIGVRREGRIEEVDDADQRVVRAIWAAEFEPNQPAPTPFDTLPSPDHRRQIVRLTSDFSIDPTYTPAPIQVDRFMLSALGGWLDARGDWNMTDALRVTHGLPLEEWRHVAAMARDQFVRTVEAGYIYPFGHRASIVTEIERTFEGNPDGSDDFGAYLRRRESVVIREQVKAYAPDRFPNQGREMPLRRSVGILTRETPYLDPTTVEPSAVAGTGGAAFWIRANGQDFPFHLRAVDVAGESVEFNGALIFVRIGATPEATNAAIAAAAVAYRDDNRRQVDVPSRQIAFAQRIPDQPGDTALTTTNLYFDTIPPVTNDPNQAPYVPYLAKADVRIPAIEQLLNSQQSVTVALHETYKAVGLADAANRAHVFAAVVGALPLAVPADRAGGLASPNMDVTGISQTFGPVAGKLNDLDAGSFKPEEFFRADARLLGAVKLSDLIEEVFDPAQFPKVVTERVPPDGAPQAIITTLNWSPQVRQPSVPGIEVVPGSTTLVLNTRIEKRLDDPTEAVTLTTGELRAFAMNFLDVVRVRFDSVAFRAQSGEKLDFSAELDQANPIEFLGELAFVNELQKFIPSNGFSDPPAIQVGPAGLEIGYSLGLPPLAVGIFALQNVSLSAALKLPFTGDPARLRFGFAERHAPFLLTVSMFGGGGFFGLEVGLDKIVLVEAALEFGGSISLNLGVASGGVYVMAGIYFKLEAGKAELTGYLRCGGSLEVLGLICISIEFYLSLGYEAGKAHGVARVTVKVEVAFFSKSVSLTVEKSFGGSAGDPTFGQLVEPEDWEAYGLAFA